MTEPPAITVLPNRPENPTHRGKESKLFAKRPRVGPSLTPSPLTPSPLAVALAQELEQARTSVVTTQQADFRELLRIT